MKSKTVNLYCRVCETEFDYEDPEEREEFFNHNCVDDGRKTGVTLA